MEDKSKINSIILLDDDSVTNFIHKKIIDDLNLGYTVETYTSGDNLLDKIESQTNPEPYFFLIDLNMPIMNAWEFLEKYEGISEIHKNPNSIIILLTTFMMNDEVDKAKDYSLIKKIVLKPLTADIVLETFKTIL